MGMPLSTHAGTEYRLQENESSRSAGFAADKLLRYEQRRRSEGSIGDQRVRPSNLDQSWTPQRHLLVRRQPSGNLLKLGVHFFFGDHAPTLLPTTYHLTISNLGISKQKTQNGTQGSRTPVPSPCK